MFLALAATALADQAYRSTILCQLGPQSAWTGFCLICYWMALIYVPLERLWPQYPKKDIPERVDLDVVYFMSIISYPSFVFSGFIAATQATKYLGVPFFKNDRSNAHGSCNSSLPLWLRTLLKYFIHLALHKVPFLWRFHSVHHSSKALDWIAGSRSTL